ncbi:MAG: circadian clock KaiB family protein [Chloroflexi bacterium]|nr:circadian clock KaiB family protein [Chloroflexota bacterium]OJV89504.1 MAG: hypothetical protein BGO39_36675 [Chloroflexi bacterium 54-19]
MGDSSKDAALEISEVGLKDTNEPHYVLRLYVSGNTTRSLQAIENIQKVCQKYLDNRYELQVIDIFQQPARAKEAQVIAVPTLLRQHPQPLRKLVGDMADEKKLLTWLDISPKDKSN